MTAGDPDRMRGTPESEEARRTAVERYRIEPDCSHEEFLAAAKLYARDVVEAYDLDARVTGLKWEVSTRAKRRAGAVKHVDGEPIAVSLTWAYFREQGWVATAETIRHELIHVHLLNRTADPTHGEDFRELADRLATSVNCERFCEPEWWVTCTECETRIARYRKSKLVSQSDQYRCRNCGGKFEIERGSG